MLSGGVIFVQVLTAKKYTEICARIIMKFEQNKKLTIQIIFDECQRILNPRSGTEEIEEKMCIDTG